MPEQKTRPRAVIEAEVCTYLGIEEDLQTCLAYPSYWNLCHRSRPVSVVRLGHQRKSCLSSGHISCPVFQSEQAGPLPMELRAQRGKIKKVSSQKSRNT